MSRLVYKTLYWRWDRAVRYRPIIKYLKHKYGSSPLTILEVGCGEYSIGLYDGFSVSGLDIRPTKNPAFLNKYIEGSILDVDMDDDSYDVVISVDVLEHIRPKDRDTAISKMLSLARKEVLLVYPCGKKSEDLDVKLYDAYKNRVSDYHIWFEEHLKNGLPTDRSVLSAVKTWSGKSGNKVILKFDKINGLNKQYKYSKFLMAKSYVWFLIKNKLLIVFDSVFGDTFKEKYYYRSFCKINVQK